LSSAEIHARRINGALALFEALASSKEGAALVGRRVATEGIRDSNMRKNADRATGLFWLPSLFKIAMENGPFIAG
jgi:hypothetical protein